MRNYPHKVAGREVVIRAQNKDAANRIYYKLRKLARTTACRVTITGIKPENETEQQRDDVYMAAKTAPDMVYGEAIFSPSSMPDEIRNWFEKMPAEIDSAFVDTHASEMQRLFLQYLAIDDFRKTEAELAEVNAEYNQRKAEQHEKENNFRKEFGGEYVTVSDEKMAIVLVMTYDDSDMMTDYYAPHCSLGEALLLAAVPKSARTEIIARQAIAKYPELAGLEWKWHTENYSMGHGNYLMSTPQGTRPKSAYDGRKEVAWSWEVQFSGSGDVLAYKNYPGETTSQTVTATGKVTLNPDKNGVEVRFPNKPAPEVISSLKSHGFRWSPTGKLWYAKQTAERIAFAQSL